MFRPYTTGKYIVVTGEDLYAHGFVRYEDAKEFVDKADEKCLILSVVLPSDMVRATDAVVGVEDHT